MGCDQGKMRGKRCETDKKSAPRKLGRTSLLTFCIKIVFLAWI